METARPLLSVALTKLKQASFLWLKGCIEACSLHRAVILCLRSRKLLIRTGQCFLLNGFLFLGSILVLNSVVIPTLLWILPDQCSQLSSQEKCPFDSVLRFYSVLRHGLVQLFYVFWFYPLYIFSFILSILWNNDIAKFGFAALGRNRPYGLEHSESEAPKEKPSGLGGVMIGIGEVIYSLLLLNFFFLEVFAVGFVPYIGKALNFILISWLYAYYCFEYKWSISGVALDRRLDFFESNWAFFAGFGSPCVFPILFFSPLVSSGFMTMLYPLFVLTATSSEADRLIFSQRRKWEGVGLRRLPIFYAADTLSMRILSFLPSDHYEKRQDTKAL